MDGPKVWEFAVDTVPRVIRSLLDEHELTPRDVDLLVLHQSNLRMLEAIMQSLEMPMDRTVTTVETYGNTAAASIPLTLQKASQTGRLRRGARVMLCGFGGGLSWGAVASRILRWGSSPAFPPRWFRGRWRFARASRRGRGARGRCCCSSPPLWP